MNIFKKKGVFHKKKINSPIFGIQQHSKVLPAPPDLSFKF